MIHGDATAAALAAVLDEEEAAAAVGLEARRRRVEAAEAGLEAVRRRRRDLEARVGEREALRVHAGRRPQAPRSSGLPGLDNRRKRAEGPQPNPGRIRP